MRNQKAILLFFIITCGKLVSFAQSSRYINDAQYWVNIYIEKKLSSRFDLHLNQQDRWTNNLSRYGQGYADFGLTYHFNKDIKMLADIVFTQKRKTNGSFSTRYQYYLAFIFKKDFGKWRFSYRFMFQNQFNDPYQSEHGLLPVYYQRNKFTAKYSFNKRFSLYAAEELYIPLNNPGNKGFDRSRTFLGGFYKFNRRIEFEAYYMLQAMLQNSTWLKTGHTFQLATLTNAWVIGTGVSYTF